MWTSCSIWHLIVWGTEPLYSESEVYISLTLISSHSQPLKQTWKVEWTSPFYSINICVHEENTGHLRPSLKNYPVPNWLKPVSRTIVVSWICFLSNQTSASNLYNGLNVCMYFFIFLDKSQAYTHRTYFSNIFYIPNIAKLGFFILSNYIDITGPTITWWNW